MGRLTRCLRSALPRVVALVGAGVVAGRLLIRHPVAADQRLVMRLSSRRCLKQDQVMLPASWITDVPRAIAVTAGLSVAIYARTRNPSRAALPALAVAIGSVVHVSTAALVRRPRPEVRRVGTEQITSSYPSGHVGAATAQALTIARLVTGLPTTSRHLLKAACLTYPLLVGWSRLYTGQHYASDVLVGFVNGAVAADIARALLAPESEHEGARGTAAE